MADVTPGGIERRHIPALAAVDQRVRLDLPSGELVLVLLVVLERQEATPRDGARHDRRDLGVVATGAGDLEAFVHRVLPEGGDNLLTHGGERTLRDVFADQIHPGNDSGRGTRFRLFDRRSLREGQWFVGR